MLITLPNQMKLWTEVPPCWVTALARVACSCCRAIAPACCIACFTQAVCVVLLQIIAGDVQSLMVCLVTSDNPYAAQHGLAPAVVTIRHCIIESLHALLSMNMLRRGEAWYEMAVVNLITGEKVVPSDHQQYHYAVEQMRL